MNATTLRIVLLSASLPYLAAEAAAQSCRVRNTYRLDNSYSGMPSELNVDTGWQVTAPLSTPGSNSNPSASCTSSSTCWPISDYGLLLLTGHGSATNCASSGIGLYLDQGPQARFEDTLTVGSATLSPGTPVQIEFVLAVQGFCTLFDPSPSIQFGADLFAGTLGLSVPNGTGSASGTVTVPVGSTLLFQCGLGVALYPQGLLGLGMPPITSTFNVDLTARVGVRSLTPGASLTFCSGTSYQTVPAQVANAGGGCGPGAPSLTATLPVLGATQTFTLANAPANAPVLFAFAPGAALPVPVGPCTITANLATATLLLVGASDVAGGFSYGLAIPMASSLAGLQFTAQELVLTPNGPLLGIGQLSNGLLATFGS